MSRPLPPPRPSSVTVDQLLDTARDVATQRGHGEVRAVHLAAAWHLLDAQGARHFLHLDIATRAAGRLAEVPAGAGPPIVAAEVTELLAWARERQAGPGRPLPPPPGPDGSPVASIVLAEGLRNLLDLNPPEDDLEAEVAWLFGEGPDPTSVPSPPAQVAPPGEGLPTPSAPPPPDPSSTGPTTDDGREGLIMPRRGRGGSSSTRSADAAEVLDVEVEGLIGLDEVVDRLADAVRRHVPGTPCLVAPKGAGRTTALRALAVRLGGLDQAKVTLVARVRAETVLGGGRGDAMRALRDNVSADTVLALDDLETLLMLGTSSVDADLRSVVRALIGNPDVRTVATIDKALLGMLRSVEPELASHLDVIELPVRGGDDLRRIGGHVAVVLASHHDLPIEVDAVTAATQPAPEDGPLAHPGLLADRLDRACARARRRGDAMVRAADVEVSPEGPDWPAVDAGVLAGRLRARVIGQDAAVDRVARRLALTSVGLDMRPDRPNGAFLLVGPSGVGKTALALALATELFGSTEHVVRLDMSELADESGLNRLIGPNPGYLGSDRPDGWFTSRMRDKPTSVVLVDEVEKAHPTVWNAFLQVLDEGRLTDSTGVPVSFSDTVVVLTSNIGSRSFDANPLGFGAADDAAAGPAAADAVRAEVARTMPPELVNRLDDVLVFQPLSRDVIAQICAVEVERLVGTLAERGWRVALDEAVLRLLADDGYDPAFGARHLQRSIERHVLENLVGLAPGDWAATVDPATATIRWAPA